MPSRLASIIAVDVLRKNHKDKLGLALLLSFAFLLVEFIIYLKKELIKWRIPKTLIAHLKNLTKEEKEILSEYVNEGKATVPMEITDGVRGGLEAKNIIFRSSNMGMFGMLFSYNIQPWALEYLKKHKKLLD